MESGYEGNLSQGTLKVHIISREIDEDVAMKLIFKDTSHNKGWRGHWTGHIYCHGATLAEQFEIDFSDGVPDFATAGSSGTDVQHSYAFGDYVIADYEGESFPGRIAKVLDSENI